MLLALVGLSAYMYLRPAGSADPSREFGGSTMGTTWRVVLGEYAGDVSPDAMQGERETVQLDVDSLQRAVDSLLREVNAIMSTYDSASELSRLNASSRVDSVPISAELARVLQQSLDVYAASGGRFDVTVGPLVDAWGFGAVARQESAPTDAVLDSLRAFVGSDKLRLGVRVVQKLHPSVRIDLSAIAKGYGVDRVSDLLLERGFANHLVEIGGELRARGRNARGEPFRVGIEEPDPDAVRVHLAVELDDRALASSGNYRNFYERNGVRYVHTLDPVTARPVQHTLLAVSVLHAECALADAWATALMAAGPEYAWTLAQDHTLDVLLLVDGGGGKVLERMTPGFEAAVRRLPQERRQNP